MSQDQLEHFLKAAIFPLKDVHSKIYKTYGQECLKEYIKMIQYGLSIIQNDQFRDEMFKAFKDVSEIIKKIGGDI